MNKLVSVLVLSGLMLVIIYLFSPSLGWDEVYFCVGGSGLILLGLLLNRLTPDRSKPSRRFRTVRKVLGSSPDEDEE